MKAAPFRARVAGILAFTALAASPALADPLHQHLTDGFEGRDFAPEGGLYYRENDEQSAGTVEFQSEIKRTGNGALKLSVRPHCKAEAENCSERAEIWEKTALRVLYDAPVWYGFAVRFADPIPSEDHRYLIAQWKREIGPGAEGDFSPFLALRLNHGKLFATIETNFHEGVFTGPEGSMADCKPGQTPVWLRPDTNQMRALVAADANFSDADGAVFNSCTDKIEVIGRGHALPQPDSGWIDFAIMTRPGPDGTGRVEIFANDAWVATVKGHIGHADKGLGDNQYFKFGPYRAADTTGWTLYYDDFRRSAECRDVLATKDLCDQIQ